MAYLWLFGCIINRHEPARRDVAWDGRTYRGKCRHCRKPIFRNGRQDWRMGEADTEA